MRSSLPALAIPYRARAVSPLRIAEAARDLWRTVWLLDRTIDGSDGTQAFLNRIGTVVDITELAPAEAAAKLAEYDPRGITAYADDDIMAVAQIAQALDLPYASTEAAERLTNKVAQRQALEAAGLPVPNFWPVAARPTSEALDALMGGVRFPVVVKPQQGASSRDTVRADDVEALRRALESADCDWMVEELLPDGWPRVDGAIADYVSVETFVSCGRTSHAAVTGKIALADPFRETGSFIPAHVSTDTLNAVLDVASAAVDAMGVPLGAFHTEIKLTPDGPRVIEVNGRLGGSALSDVFTLACGQSPHRLVGRVALGEEVVFAAPIRCEQVAYLWSPQPPMAARRLTKLEHLDDARAVAGVQEIRLNRQVGDELDWRVGTQGALYVVVGVAADAQMMIDTLRTISAVVEVEYDC